MDVLFYMIVMLFGSQTSNAKVSSEDLDDVYITNFTTSYYDIPAYCDLFGSEFGENHPVQNLIIDITANGIYWIGAKLGFKRNINPVGVQPECTSNYNESLDGCNRLCKGQKYFSYNEQSCTCSNDNKAIRGLNKAAKKCKNQEHGLCSEKGCVVYERDVLNNDYLCDVYQLSKDLGDFIFTTHNCSAKLSFICAGDKLQPSAINSSWLVADHVCSKKDQHLLQTKTILGKEFNGTKYWISLFRRKRFFWGYDNTKTVCVAARIQANGSYRLESHFCNESLEALCHKPGRTYYSSSDAEVITASFGTVVGVVVVCIIVVAAINYRRLKKVNERLSGTDFSTYTEIEENNVELNNLGYNELDVSTSHRLAEFREIEIDTRDDAMDYQGYLVPEQHYHTIPEREAHYTEISIAENNAVN